ncbi:type IV pilus secretin family protein [Sulfuricystis multivorans]|uniref:type IV pilus secretin family protein n=1 Tax=Sulfuricystis multivorans TaxID=2211108 RepID=UPI001558B259|nr:type IV pilus secretin family protein [Sulfuricystis multivorans]
MKFMRLLMTGLTLLLAAVTPSLAQNAEQTGKTNVIESLEVGKVAGSTVVKLTLRKELAATPSNFMITNPARIVFDFPATENGLGHTSKPVNEGVLRSYNVVQAGDRSRLVLNLAQNARFEARVDGKRLTITLLDDVRSDVAATPAGVQHFAQTGRSEENEIRSIQFRRNKEGAGVVLVDMSSSDAAIDVTQKGSKLYVAFKKTRLPESQRKRLDVVDFGTPVTAVTTRPEGDGVTMEIVPTGLWEHTAYQSDNQFIVEVRPVKEDPSKLFQGSKKGYQGELVSLNFQNIPLRELLHVFADITNFNIVISDSVGGNVSLRLNDVPWDQALEIVLQQKNLAMRKNGNVIWIAPQDELAARDEQAIKSRETAIAAEQPRLELFQLNYVKAEDLLTMIEKEKDDLKGKDKASAFLSSVGKITIDKRTNQVFIYDVPSKLEMISSLLKQIDRPVRQVLIEARIVEADTNFTKSLGVRLGTHDHQGMNVGHSIGSDTNVRFGLAASSEDAYAHLPELGNYPATAIITDIDRTTGEITYTREVPTPKLVNSQMVNLAVPNPAGQFALTLMNRAKTMLLTLELSALEADGKGKTISSPRIMTMDQMEATIQQGVRVPYLVSSASGATSIAWQDANLSLKVKPHITPDGRVMLKLKITKNALGPQVSSFLGYSIKTKEVESDVLVDNGGTVVIGGIYEQEERDSTTRVPFLGDLPYVGFLFKTRSRTDNRVELLVMITPKIIDNALSMR